MKRCKRCLMANTKPGLILDDQGICQACRHYETRASTDYNQRFEELRTLTGKYKRKDGVYDCLIAVSSGKDSHFQVYVMKELLGMNPLLVSAGDPFTKTEAGRHNLNNIAESFHARIHSWRERTYLIPSRIWLARASQV